MATRWQPTQVGGQFFTYRKDLDEAITREKQRLAVDIPVYSAFLAAVVNTFHPAVLQAGVTATGWFEFLTPEGQSMRNLGDTYYEWRQPIELVRAFIDPNNAWYPISLRPWKKSENPRLHVKRSLRELWAISQPRPLRFDRCAVADANCFGGLEYDHVYPTFNDIAERCLTLMTEEEITTMFGYNKFKPGFEEIRTLIPKTHPAIVYLIEAHRTNVWRWVCAYHHRKVKPANSDDFSFE